MHGLVYDQAVSEKSFFSVTTGMGWGRALLLKLYRGQRSFLVLYTQSGPEMARAWRVCIRNGSHGHSYNMPNAFYFHSSSIITPPSVAVIRCLISRSLAPSHNDTVLPQGLTRVPTRLRLPAMLVWPGAELRCRLGLP